MAKESALDYLNKVLDTETVTDATYTWQQNRMSPEPHLDIHGNLLPGMHYPTTLGDIVKGTPGAAKTLASAVGEFALDVVKAPANMVTGIQAELLPTMTPMGMMRTGGPIAAVATGTADIYQPISEQGHLLLEGVGSFDPTAVADGINTLIYGIEEAMGVDWVTPSHIVWSGAATMMVGISPSMIKKTGKTLSQKKEYMKEVLKDPLVHLSGHGLKVSKMEPGKLYDEVAAGIEEVRMLYSTPGAYSRFLNVLIDGPLVDLQKLKKSRITASSLEDFTDLENILIKHKNKIRVENESLLRKFYDSPSSGADIDQSILDHLRMGQADENKLIEKFLQPVRNLHGKDEAYTALQHEYKEALIAKFMNLDHKASKQMYDFYVESVNRKLDNIHTYVGVPAPKGHRAYDPSAAKKIGGYAQSTEQSGSVIIKDGTIDPRSTAVHESIHVLQLGGNTIETIYHAFALKYNTIFRSGTNIGPDWGRKWHGRSPKIVKHVTSPHHSFENVGGGGVLSVDIHKNLPNPFHSVNMHGQRVYDDMLGNISIGSLAKPKGSSIGSGSGINSKMWLPSFQQKLFQNMKPHISGLKKEARLGGVAFDEKKLKELEYYEYLMDWWETTARYGEIRAGRIFDPYVPEKSVGFLRSASKRSKSHIDINEFLGTAREGAHKANMQLGQIYQRKNPEFIKDMYSKVWSAAPLMSYPTIKQLLKEQERE